MNATLLRHTFQTPGGNAVSMAYRDGTNDWNTLTSCLTQDEYELPTGLTGTAVDVGGHLGSVGIALALDNPALRVVIIEPVPDNCVLIRENIERNGLALRVDLIEGAAGGIDEIVPVRYAYEGSEMLGHHAYIGNLTLAADERPTYSKVITYEATPLAALVPLTFLKIDAEGAEYAFLDDPAVAQVETIVGEWHNNDGHVIGDILALLDKTHVVTFSGPQTGPGGFRAVRR